MKSYYDIKECIYLIENIVNNKAYIGQTLNLIIRMENHYKNFIKGKNNKNLQKDYEEYGLENFRFKVLEIINPERIESNNLLGIYMLYRENYYIDKYNSIEEGYNIIKAEKIDYTKIDINRKDYYMAFDKLEPFNFKEFIDLQLDIKDLCKLYFMYNPQYNKGMAFKVKTNDIITNYMINHNMKYKDVKACIEMFPMCKEPVWNQFYNYWYKEDMRNKNNIKKKVEKTKKSHYKDSISDSTNVDDWI